MAAPASAVAVPTVEERLQAWAQAGDTRFQRHARTAAMSQILEAIADGRGILDLSGQQLDSLPDCLQELHQLDELYVSTNGLTALPPLPPRLRNLTAAHNGLLSLPVLPSSLQELNVSSNELTTLPPLPPHLTILSARDNAIASLPALPPGLTHLEVCENRLRALPAELPVGLMALLAGSNQLDDLPTPLPQTLEFLWVQANRLTSLPSELPPRLTALQCFDNPITEIPDALLTLPGEANVILSRSLLTPVAQGRIDAYQEWHRDPANRNLGPTIELVEPDDLDWLARASADGSEEDVGPDFTLDTQAFPHDDIALAAGWWTGMTTDEHAAHGPEREASWQSIVRDMGADPDAVSRAEGFARFLGKLSRTSEFRHPDLRVQLRARTSALLDRLEVDADLRAVCMVIADEHSNTCGDAATAALAAMELAVMTADAASGHTPTPQLIHLGKQLLRLKALDDFGATLGKSDHVEYLELNLWLRTNLAEQLDLPIRSRAMLYTNFVERSLEVGPSTLTDAAAHVAAVVADRQKTVEFLADWQPWTKRLEKAYPEQLQQDRETRQSQRMALVEKAFELFERSESSNDGRYHSQMGALQSEAQSLEGNSRALLVQLTEAELARHGQ